MPGLPRELRPEEKLLGPVEVPAPDLETRPLEDGEAGRPGAPRLDAAELGDGAVEVAELLLHRAEVETDAAGKRGRPVAVVRLARAGRGTPSAERRAGPRTPSLPRRSGRASRAGGRARTARPRSRRRPIPRGRASRARRRAARRARGRAGRGRCRRGGARSGVGKVLRVLPLELAREEGRGGVVAPRLGEEGQAELRRLLHRAFPLERLCAEHLETPAFAGRRLRPGGDEAREGHGVEARLERVEGGPQRAARHGSFLPLEEREEELEGVEAVPLLEPEARGGEARRNVEEVARRDEALEADEGLVRAAEPRERARGEEVESAVGVACRREPVELAERREDVGPVLGAGRFGRLALEGAEGVGSGGRGSRGRRGQRHRRSPRGRRRDEREERDGGEPPRSRPRAARAVTRRRARRGRRARRASPPSPRSPGRGGRCASRASRPRRRGRPGRAPPRRAGRRR